MKINEVKIRSLKPKVTNDLKTIKNYIIIPTGKKYRLREDITVCDINEFLVLLSST